MKLAYQYDSSGLLVAAVYLENHDPIPDSCTTVMPSVDLKTKPKWNGETWVESGIPLQTYPEAKEPSDTQKLLMQQSQQITLLQTMAMQQDQDNAKLQEANAKQVSQIKQLQQMFMVADQQQAIEKSKEVTTQ